MKTIILVVAFGCAVASASTLVRMDGSGYSTDVKSSSSYYSSYGDSTSKFIPITKYLQEIRGGESDSTSFETGNGIRVHDTTSLSGPGRAYDDGYGKMVTSGASLVKSGSYNYVAPDGTPISMTWTADENGFKPEGAHIPTPPPVPAEIAASLRSSSSYGYSAPVRSSDYAAPAIRMEYTAPVVRNDYVAPVVRNDYAAPMVVRSDYSAPTSVRIQY